MKRSQESLGGLNLPLPIKLPGHHHGKPLKNQLVRVFSTILGNNLWLYIHFCVESKILFIASHCLASFRTASPLSLNREWVGVGCLRPCGMWLFIGTMWGVGTLAPGLWRASLLAQTVKNPPAMQETQVWSLSWEDPMKGMTTHSSILAWRIPWTEEPGGL